MSNKLEQNKTSTQRNKNNINLNNLSSSSESDEEDGQFNISETKNNILKAFDDQISKNKEEFKQITLIKQKKNEIYKLAKDLKVDIKNLDSAINEIIKKQHDDYLNTFSSFMDSIRKELTQKLEEMERQAEEKKKANDIRLIKCERDFFRMEAVRLNGICKSFKEKIDELSFRNKLITDELNTLKIKWKESENINKQLLFELESNIQSYKELEEKFNSTKNIIDRKTNIKFNVDKSSSMDDKHNNYIFDNKEGSKSNNYVESEAKDFGEGMGVIPKDRKIFELTEKMKKYKHEAKIYKEKAHKALAELNKNFLEKNKLENIFNDCVNETKKLIYKRKLKENKGYKIKNKTGLGKYDVKINFITKYDDFLPGDKMSTLENFIFNDEVYNYIKDAIFNHPPVSNKKNESVKKLMSDYNFYDPDWKMKEIIENASSDLTKNDNFLPLMSVGNKKPNSNKDNNIDINFKDKAKTNSQFYRTGKIAIMNPLIPKKQQIGTSSKLTMNLQV